MLHLNGTITGGKGLSIQQCKAFLQKEYKKLKELEKRLRLLLNSLRFLNKVLRLLEKELLRKKKIFDFFSILIK